MFRSCPYLITAESRLLCGLMSAVIFYLGDKRIYLWVILQQPSIQILLATQKLTKVFALFDCGRIMDKLIVLPFGSSAFTNLVNDFFSMKNHVCVCCCIHKNKSISRRTQPPSNNNDCSIMRASMTKTTTILLTFKANNQPRIVDLLVFTIKVRPHVSQTIPFPWKGPPSSLCWIPLSIGL